MKRFIRQIIGMRQLRRAVRLHQRGTEALEQKDFDTAYKLYEASLEQFRKQEHWHGVLWTRSSLGYLDFQRQNYPAARSHFEQCVSLARNSRNDEHLVMSLSGLGTVALLQGHSELTIRLGTELLKLGQAKSKEEWIAAAYQLLGSAAPNTQESRTHYVEAMKLYRKLNVPQSLLSILVSLGHLAEPGRENTEERGYLTECLETCRGSNNKTTLSYALNNMGNVERYAGNLPEAEKLYRESIALKQEIGDEWAIAYSLENLAALALMRQQGERATRLSGAASRIRERLGTPLERHKQAEYENNLIETRLLLNSEMFEEIWNEGKALSVAEAVEYALERKPRGDA